MKRAISLLLVAALMVTLFAGCSSKKQASGTLNAGGNAINADMFSGWSNLVSNANIKDLIYGYGTVSYTADDKFIMNPTVVKDSSITENADGSKTYTIEIKNNLTYNDKTKITAKDYVFSMLFNCSPELLELECDRATGNEMYNGFTAYNSGETKVFSGMRLLGDYKFSMTVDAETDGESNFPFWYEITYASAAPLPMHVLAPGCDVADDGNGAYITGSYTVDLLKSTVDNGSTGYRYNPTVTCGPYQFVSYDEASQQAIIEVNPEFAGDYKGSIPQIKTIVMKLVESATAIDAFSTGETDLLLGMSGAQNINAGLDLVDQGKATAVTYARNGYGKITFHCNDGPTQFAEVRRAIAYCMDREEFVRQYTGGFGVIVHSRIGNAQWMYQDNKKYLEDNLTVYTLNVDKALEELVNGGWIYDANGGEYKSGIRHKKLDDGSYMPLVIEWFSPNSNPIGEMLNTFLVGNAETIGFKINQTFGDSAAFGDALYNYSEKFYHMVNGGSGFSSMDSPWYYFDISFPVQYNTNVIDDPILKSSTLAMKQTATGDNATFSKHWLTFVERFNELLPDIPLYSDLYHDFVNPKLKNYNPTALWGWTGAILDAYIEEGE